MHALSKKRITRATVCMVARRISEKMGHSPTDRCQSPGMSSHWYAELAKSVPQIGTSARTRPQGTAGARVNGGKADAAGEERKAEVSGVRDVLRALAPASRGRGHAGCEDVSAVPASVYGTEPCRSGCHRALSGVGCSTILMRETQISPMSPRLWLRRGQLVEQPSGWSCISTR